MPWVRSSQISLRSMSDLVVVDRLRHHLDELRALVPEARRHVLCQSADLEVARVHSKTGDELEEIEDAIALAEAVPEHRDCSELERGRPEPHEMRVDPVQLREQHAHPRRPGRDLDVEQLLDCENEDELVVLERHVVDARRIRDRLPPALLLHALLEAGVQVADDGGEPDDFLAVQIDDQPQHAVRGGMVRPEVHREDVLRRPQVFAHLEHARDRRGDTRSLVDLRTLGSDRHLFLSAKIGPARRRSGSPCAAGGLPSRRP